MGAHHSGYDWPPTDGAGSADTILAVIPLTICKRNGQPKITEGYEVAINIQNTYSSAFNAFSFIRIRMTIPRTGRTTVTRVKA